MIANKKNPKHIVFPSHNNTEIRFAVNWSLKKILPNGWVNIEAKIPAKCIDLNGFVKREVIDLLRQPCAENRFALRAMYGVIASYDYHVVSESASPIMAEIAA